jgi:hypothetical protein
MNIPCRFSLLDKKRRLLNRLMVLPVSTGTVSTNVPVFYNLILYANYLSQVRLNAHHP